MDESKNILVTGASGFIGRHLSSAFSVAGHRIYKLGRSKRSNDPGAFVWRVNDGYIDPLAIENKQAIVHLAGAGVADKRWSSERKKEILSSRIDSTRLLFQALERSKHNVKTFVSASAIGYYGLGGDDRWYTEESAPGTDFLADVTHQWETEVDKIASLGIRVVKIRIGIVLSGEAGALPKMANPVKYFAGACLGSGTQPVSWIHVDDLCAIFLRAVNDTNWNGAYNAVAPDPVSNSQLTKIIAEVLNKPLWLPNVPRFVLKIMLGEMADIVTHGTRVSATKLLNTGFHFRFSNAREAVQDLLVS